MRKDSSHSSRDSAPGRSSSFKKSSGGKPFNKESKPFKKNYDGRGPSSADGGRSSKPYSGRSTDTGARPASDRPGRDDGERKPRKEFDKSRRPSEGRPFDKAKRPFEDRRGGSDKPSFGRVEGKKWDDRKPRIADGGKPYDKPKRPYEDRREGSGKPPFEKGEGKKWEDRKPRTSEGGKPYDKPKRPYEDRREGPGKPPSDRGESKQWEERKPRSAEGGKPYDKPKRPYEDRRTGSDKPSFGKGDDRKPRSPGDSRPFRDRPNPHPGKKAAFDKPGFDKQDEDNKPDPRTFDKVLKNAFNPVKKKRVENDNDPSKPFIHEDKVFGELEEPVSEVNPIIKSDARLGGNEKRKVNPAFTKKKFIHDHSGGRKKKYDDEDEDDDDSTVKVPSDGLMPLNKFIAHSGECSRRDAAELVKQGKVKVNGELILDPGHKVHYDANVTLVGKKLKPQKDNVYILLNKPKGFITTNEDPQGRKTVMDLVSNSGADRLFPVGRLDRDTSGLLLITNDGDLTQKLCHPSYNIKKVYQVTLDKPLTKADFEKIIEGVELEDGKAIVDAIAYLETKSELGLEIHSGKNRIVRRIFESLGYVVEKLDRMMYAGLTKKNLPRGKWRHLDPREVILLKHFKS